MATVTKPPLTNDAPRPNLLELPPAVAMKTMPATSISIAIATVAHMT